MTNRVIFLLFAITVSGMFRCPQEATFRRFFKIRTCHRHGGKIVSKGSFTTVNGCMDFAREKNGFAINYSPPELSGEYFNCHVLDCPEQTNLSSLVKDTSFDYYSSYGNTLALQNSTCLRGIGVFRIFLDKANYSEAILKCQENGGELAHILTEHRTTSLSILIGNEMKEWYKAAYVGLDDRENEGRFVTPLGEPMSCFKYRAWSPGHPRNRRETEDCVILDNDKTWKVVDCSIKLPFLCELYNEGPGKSNESFNLNCATIEDKELQWECKMLKRQMNTIYDEEGDSSSDRCPIDTTNSTTTPSTEFKV